uniref:Proto-oncogene tyrosine-protein kinase receptor Ret n=1 Tax=Schistosoma mansoni TaxID=6183 RepID=A0A5K4FCQ2_SCHMA
MFLNKLLDYNGFASVPFTNEKAKVNSLHYFDFYGCYFSCCDHKFHNKPEIEDDEMVIARQTTNNLEVPTDFWNFFERFCKHINVSKMSMNSPTYSNIQRHLTSEVERREFMNNGNNIYFCSYCIRNYMLKASIKYDMNTEQYLNLFLFRKFSLRSPRSIIKTKDKMSSFNKTGNMIPTFTLPAVNSVPVRAVSIHSSNLLPSSSGNIINDFNQVTFPHYQFNVVQIKYGIIQIKVDDDRATWKQTTTFSGLQVIEQKVRYISLVAQPESMQIAFNDRIHIACFRNLEKSNIMRLVLPVNFIRIHISITVNRPLLIYVSTVNDKINPHLIGMEGRTARLDSRYLEVRAEPWEKDSLIWFTVTKIPMHGHLFLVNRSSQQTNTNKELDDKIYLGVSSKFTQEDLRAGNLFYTFRRVLDDSLERTSDVSSKRFSLMDEFKYRVNVEGAQPKTIYDFRIVINKISSATSISTNKFSPTIINRGGIVEEGGDLILTPELFYAKHSQCQNNSVQKSSDDLFQDYDLYFQILSLPEHGTLLIKSPYNSTLTNLINLTEYNHKLISHNLLIYRHNGEEEFKDSFQFQFFCRQTPISHSYDDTNDDITVHLTGLTHTSVDELFGQPVTSVFRIRIIPVNDNPPNLYITPLFVEFNKTNNTLSKSFKIIDKDKNLQNDYFDNNDNDNELIYKRGDFWIYWEENKNFQRKDIIYPSLGYFIQNLDMTVSRRFKYSELTNGLINFKHMGLPTGQVNLKVMDGKFTVTKLLTINATKPSLLVLQPSRITLRPNGRVFIPIEVITNVHLDPSDIQINVIRSGCFGNLVLFGLTDQSTNWTYNDLLQFPLYYEYISSWSQSKLQNITSFKSTARSLYCKLLYSNSKNDKKDDFLTLRSDEVYLFVSTTFSGHILQQEVRLSILLSQLKLWDDGNINGGNDVKFTSDELTVETGKSVVVQPNFFPNNNDTRSFSQIPIIVNQEPRYGILHLCTTNFKISSIKYFTLADLFSGRILYESLTNRLNTIQTYYKQSLLIKDCITIFLLNNQFQYGMNNYVSDQINNETEIESRQVICFLIMQKGLDVKHWNLALDAKNYRSLTDSKLTPILNKENPVRHDEPFIATNEGSFSLTSKNTEYDMTQLSESILELDAPYAQNKYSTSSNRDPKKNVKTLYTVKNGPSYGLIISKKLNRTVRLFSDVDLATNDIYYQNFGNTSISEDSVDLQVLELTTKTMTVNPVKIKFTLNEMNSRPYLKTCRPMRILTGSSVVIHTDYLNAALTSGFNSDQITYEILYTHQGHVVFLNSFSVSLSTFTQMDLRQGRVGFVHSGSQKGTACGFAFVLIYNLYRSDIYQFQIIPGTVELNVISNRTLLVFPKGFEIITPHHISTQIKFSTLKSMDYESHSTALKNNNLSNTSSSLPCLMPRQCQLENELGLYVVYKVLSQPTYGSIVRFSVTDRSHLAIWNDSINEFTQEEIKLGRIAYKFHPNKWHTNRNQLTLSQYNSVIEDEYILSASIVKRTTIINKNNEKNYNNINIKDHNIGDVSNYNDYTEHLTSQIIFGSISISYDYIFKYNQNRLLSINPLILHNGHTGDITLNHINPNPILELFKTNKSESKNLKIARPPEHGTLWLGSKRMETGSIIPGLLSGELVEKLIYRHDGSLTKKDSFELLVYQLNRSLTSYEQPISFPIQIVPNLNTSLKLIYPVNQINKNNLLSRSKTLITVEMNDYVTITNEHLYVQHEFIQPQFIYIHFKTLPKYGKLYYSYNSFKQEHDMLTPECETLYKITQNDVNLKRLRYFANNVDGSKEDPNIAVYDSATFEIYQNEYPNLQMNKLSGVLQFQIILSNVVLNNSVQLSLLQNETKLWLDAEMLQVQSSRWKNYQHDYQTNLFTFFHIKQIPSYGRVFVDTIPVHRFSYTQLEQNRVYYEKTNFSTPHDSFTIEIKKFVCGMSLRTRSNILDWLPNELSGEHSSYMTFTVNITVQSLISFDTLYVSPGKMTKIDPQNLEISKFHELLHKYNIPNQMPTKNNRKVTSITMFTFPTGTMLQSGRFYINNRLVISSGYLNDKLTSSIGISLQDFLSNNVYFEAYQIPNEGIEIYEETIPYIFTLGTFFTPQMYFTTSDPIFVQPGYGDLKISIKNFLFSTTANNNFNINDSISRSVSISSPSVVSSTSKIDMINNISRYSGTGRIAFTIAGLALSLAFISVVIICSIGCCIYKRKNKTSKSILGMSNQSEEKVSTSFPLTMTTLTRETVNSPNKYILKSNHDSIELCSFHEINESGKLHSDEGVNNLTLSNQPSRVTFNNKVDINRIISVEPSVQSVQDFSCSCDFSGAVVYWTTDMEASTSVPAISCQNDNNFSNYGNYYSNHAFHLISTNDKIISQPPTLSSSLSSNILPTQQHTAQFSSPVLLAQLPATSLNLPHLTLLSPSEAANQINMNIVPLESQFLNASKVENEKTKVENVQLSSEIFDHDNLKCVDKVIESRCDDFLFNESQKCNSINTPLICIQNNVYGKHFDISLMNEQI